MSRIAVIEDEPTDFSAIARVLGSNHQIVNWATGGEALDAFEQDSGEPVRVIIVDLGLPDMHGSEVIRRIRALPRGTHPAIFALTSSSDPSDRDRVDAAGADDYFVKPGTIAGLRGIAAQIADISGITLDR
ncbi:MAG: response regulator [Solirubrobacteraceae bacterium]|nr:response regulator [Solirubrobacteraceae bacterium]